MPVRSKKRGLNAVKNRIVKAQVKCGRLMVLAFASHGPARWSVTAAPSARALLVLLSGYGPSESLAWTMPLA